MESSKNLVKRLRSLADPDMPNDIGELWNGLDEAADYIEQQLEEKLRALTADPALLKALEDCANDLESEIEGHYSGIKDHPAMAPKYERDMETVKIARAAIAKYRSAPSKGENDLENGIEGRFSKFLTSSVR